MGSGPFTSGNSSLIDGELDLNCREFIRDIGAMIQRWQADVDPINSNVANGASRRGAAEEVADTD